MKKLILVCAFGALVSGCGQSSGGQNPQNSTPQGGSSQLSEPVKDCGPTEQKYYFDFLAITEGGTALEYQFVTDCQLMKVDELITGTGCMLPTQTGKVNSTNTIAASVCNRIWVYPSSPSPVSTSKVSTIGGLCTDAAVKAYAEILTALKHKPTNDVEEQYLKNMCYEFWGFFNRESCVASDGTKVTSVMFTTCNKLLANGSDVGGSD